MTQQRTASLRIRWPNLVRRAHARIVTDDGTPPTLPPPTGEPSYEPLVGCPKPELYLAHPDCEIPSQVRISHNVTNRHGSGCAQDTCVDAFDALLADPIGVSSESCSGFAEGGGICLPQNERCSVVISFKASEYLTGVSGQWSVSVQVGLYYDNNLTALDIYGHPDHSETTRYALFSGIVLDDRAPTPIKNCGGPWKCVGGGYSRGSSLCEFGSYVMVGAA